MIFRKISIWLALAGLVLGTMLVLRVSAKQPQPELPLPLPKKPFEHGIGASGIIEARAKNTSIGVPVDGLVTKIYVDVWGRVEKGSPLFDIDDRDLQAQLLSAQAQVALKSAQLERAQDQFNRLQAVDDPRAISAQDLKDRKLDVTVAMADLSSAKASVEQLKLLIDRYHVRSPIAGTILQVNIQEGESVSSASTTPPMILGNIDDVWVRADIDEQVAPRVQTGSAAVGYLKGDATHPIPMDFVRIEPYVIPKMSLTGASTERVDTRVLQVIYQFHNLSDRRVYVGQQVDLFIQSNP